MRKDFLLATKEMGIYCSLEQIGGVNSAYFHTYDLVVDVNKVEALYN
jgi:hypothetical protein